MKDISGAWQNDAMSSSASKPVLSVCVPFFKFDVSKLVDCLLRQSLPFRDALEILLADDASGDAGQVNRLKEMAASVKVPVRLVVFRLNQGRARIRSYLTETACGSYVLFIDCDMYPDCEEFVARYFELAKQGIEHIVVGGCSYRQIKHVPSSQYLYYYHSDRTQCVPVDGRRRFPLRYVFTNNMMIRRDLLTRLSFDVSYIGWGYEDTDLAIGASRAGSRILHIENTATHFGLIDDNNLIGKYRNSAANFLRLVQKFPGEAEGLPVFRAARAMSRIPLPFTWLSSAFESLVCVSLFPVKIRYLFLQCFKVVLYAAAMRRQ